MSGTDFPSTPLLVLMGSGFGVYLLLAFFSCSGACEFTQLRLTDLLRFPSSETLNKPVPQAKEWMLLVPDSLWSSLCICSIRSNENRTAVLTQVRLAFTPALSLFILLTFSHKPGLIGGVWWHRQRELFKGQWVHFKLVINMTYLDSWSQHPLSLLILPWGVCLISVCRYSQPNPQLQIWAGSRAIRE